MNDSDTAQMTHWLTEWDRRQSARDRFHNRYFLGIALQALADADPQTAEDAMECFTGRLGAFIRKNWGTPGYWDKLAH